MIVGVHSLKEIRWRGKNETTENVYHYDTGIVPPTDAGWNDLADALVAKERSIFGSNVKFLQVRIHGPTDQGQDDDIMRFVKDYANIFGQAATTIEMPPELAAVYSFYIGRSERGYKRYLRKFLHLGNVPASGNFGYSIGKDPMGAATRTAITTFANDTKAIAVGGNDNILCAPNGTKVPSGATPIVSDFAHTRQFRRGRKRRTSAAA